MGRGAAALVLAKGSEAYREMWERAIGIAPRHRCKSRRLRFNREGLGPVAFGVSGEDELRVTFNRRGLADRISYRVGNRLQTRRAARAGR